MQMKDYYYILGVNRDASELEIRTAYKKLSIKFHPDKNQGDSFFEDRFKEVQEAYEVLSNPLKRANYNAELEPRMAREHLETIDTNPPIISVFEASKKSIREGDPITLRWQTVHANEVEINCIGKVSTAGTKTVRLPMIYNKDKIIIELVAKNSFIKQQSSKKIVIKNKSYNDRKVQMLYSEGGGQPVEEDITEQKIEEVTVPTEERPAMETEEALKELFKEKKDPKQGKIKKEKVAREPTKEERLNGITAIIAENEEDTKRGFQKSDIFIYIVVVVLLIFITIMSIFAYRMNPF
jgi:curved DNA-binding protein CbpA